MTGVLDGRRVLITGASRGIGRAIAQVFAREQATLYLNGRDEERLVALADELSAHYGVDCSVLAFDVADSDAVKAGFRKLFAQMKTLDVLINNAGIRDDALLAMVTPKSLEQSFAVNSFGAFYCAQYAARMMRRNGGGSIVNMASAMALGGYPGQSVYAASKAALVGMTRSLAKELSGDKIRVNAIAPGLIETDLVADLTSAQRDQHIKQIALGRMGQAEEVARCALFLSCDWSGYMTGELLHVDGGMAL